MTLMERRWKKVLRKTNKKILRLTLNWIKNTIICIKKISAFQMIKKY